MDAILRQAKIDFVGKKPKDVAERLKRMRETAELSRKSGETTAAFIILKRWMYSVEWIRKTKHHKENPSFYTSYINNKDVEDVKAILGELEGKLIAQFSPKTPIMEVDDVIDTSSKGGTLKSTEGALNLPETPTEEPLAPESDEFVSCLQLFQLMQPNNRWLIIDTRPADDYGVSRIKSNRCINIPEEKIIPGVIASRFEKLLCNDKEACHLFKQRSAQYCDAVVLLDWNSTRDTLFPGNRVRSLKEILQSWDPSVKPAKIMILNGGYTEWLNRYPAHVTNPHAKVPDVHTNAMDEILDDVEYPPDWLNTDDSSSPFHSLRIQPLPPRNSKPNTSVKSMNEVIMDRLKKDEESSSYNTNSPVASNNHQDQSSVFTNENDGIRNPYDLANKKKSEMKKYTRRFDDQDTESMHTDEDEIMPHTTNLPNKLTVQDVTPKPRIDRSSKPSSLTPQYADCSDLLELMKQLYDTVKCQERIENQILSNEREWHLLDLDNNPELREVKKENWKAHNKALEGVKARKAEMKDALATQKIDESSMSPRDKREKDRFELEIGSIEQRLANICFERKKLHEQIRDNQLQKTDLLAQKRNENGVYKEPLKSDGSSTNTSLKRSHSSPNLAQLDDRKVPHVDRTSKPHVPVPQTPNRVRTGLNNKFLPKSWKDRTDRMEPIYRDVHPGITGLKNLGNSCYMNSIIQCLSNTAYLAKYFNDNSYVADLNTANNNSVQGQVAEEVAQVIKALWRGQYKSISPRDLKVVIGQYKLQFNSFDQQDSHEFLTFLLDWMHNDLKRPAKIRIDGPLSSAEKEWDKAMESQRSIISHLFFGQLRSSIICNTCGKSSTTYETFNSLTMTINDTKSCTLDQCVQKYVTGQTISDWKCAHCKVPREATKKFDFMKLAPIVVIHLNRFGDTDGWLRKQDTPVDFPLTGFDLKPYLVADPESRNAVDHSNNYRYSLYAMSNHYGTMEGGHYTAYCKSASQNKWYKYDDQTVTEVLPNAVKSGNTTSAYLLFYTSLSNEPYGYR